jgi:N-acetylneuraminic acid mutarotase
MIPWQPSPPELALPAPRTDGALVATGTQLVSIGGTDAVNGRARADVYVANLYTSGNFSKWSAGPSLPVPLKNATAAYLGGSVYVFGGTDPSGGPTTTALVSTVDPNTGALGQWQTADQAKLPLALPAARTAGALVVTGDGLMYVGGDDGKGPVTTVWKSTLDKNAKLTAWKENAPLFRPQSHEGAFLIGNYLWVYGGRDANGPTGAVQRGNFATSTGNAGAIVQWAISNGANLPVPRADASYFSANGVLYLAGGTDGKAPKGEVYWTTPTNDGDITEWTHLAPSDLPAQGLAGAPGLVYGTNAFLVGGTTSTGVIDSTVRANMAPKSPFFQLGLVGATVPALGIQGEIGQQLGYLNAALVGTVDFVILILVGVAIAHPERTRDLGGRILRRPRSD